MLVLVGVGSVVFVGSGVGVVVLVGSGVGVGVSVAVGSGVAVGSSVGVGVGVSCAKADCRRVKAKNKTIIVQICFFMFVTPLWFYACCVVDFWGCVGDWCGVGGYA